ncbi:hypothetical protein BpHYR1_000739 [Brachionus plicatilis]|uniref:Uncharacterized protein n=1 Tax=Brachionus plicatilis TaxID=10195 RepID=A0A3M7S3A9_BRAPC|nr:hypothetical protein BpHYR1_000739 [Brachionus plicatilis]
MHNEKHNFKNLTLLFISVLTYSTVLILNKLASKKIFFPNDVGSISRRFPLDITPAPIIFPVIWSIIYFWQTIWLIYAAIFHFRRCSNRYLLYRVVPLFHPVFFIGFIANNIGMIVWLFVWTNKLVGWSFVGLLFLTLSLYLALYVSYKSLYLSQDQLFILNLKKDLWLVRILVQNGLAFFATWVTIASCLNLATYLTYDLLIELSISTTCSLSILSFICVLFSIFENFIWQKYLLYTFSPWLVLLTGLSGSLYKNYPKNEQNLSRNNILTMCLLMACACFFVVKIVMFSLYKTIWKERVDKKESHRLLQAKQDNQAPL